MNTFAKRAIFLLLGCLCGVFSVSAQSWYIGTVPSNFSTTNGGQNFWFLSLASGTYANLSYYNNFCTVANTNPTYTGGGSACSDPYLVTRLDYYTLPISYKMLIGTLTSTKDVTVRFDPKKTDMYINFTVRFYELSTTVASLKNNSIIIYNRTRSATTLYYNVSTNNTVVNVSQNYVFMKENSTIEFNVFKASSNPTNVFAISINITTTDAPSSIPVITFVNNPANNTAITTNFQYFNVSSDIAVDNCTLNFNNTNYAMSNATPLNTSYFYNVTNILNATYNYFANCSLTSVPYITSTYNMSVDPLNVSFVNNPANNTAITTNFQYFNVSTSWMVDNCSLNFNNINYAMNNASSSNMSFFYNKTGIKGGVYNYFANCSLTSIPYITSTYNMSVPYFYSIIGFVHYNGSYFENATVQLMNYSGNNTIATAKTNITGGYFFSGQTYTQLKNNSLWLLNVWFTNANMNLSGHGFVNVTVED